MLALTLLVCASACDSGPNVTGLRGLSDDPALLVGAWQWERSVVCDAEAPCVETTPASSGQAQTLAFADGGTLTGYFDRGLAVAPVGYEIVRDTDGRNRIRLDAPGIKGNADYAFGVSRDRFVTQYVYIDGTVYESTYRRDR